MKPIRIAILTLVSALLLVSQSRRSYPPDRIWWGANQSGTLPATEDYDNADGMVGIINADGAVNPVGHAFFEALGTNGRACVTCHQPSNAMSVSVEAIQGRWRETGGTDPVFAAIDGSDCPSLPQDKALLLRVRPRLARGVQAPEHQTHTRHEGWLRSRRP